MNLTIINDTSFKRVTVSLGGNEYHLRPGENTFTGIPSIFEMGINIHDGNSFTGLWLLLLLNIIFFDWITDTEVYADLYCNSMYRLHTDKENCTIKLTGLRAAYKTPVSYNSVFLDTDDAAIEYASHTITNKEESKKKYKNRNLLCIGIYFAIAVAVSACLMSIDWDMIFVVVPFFLLCVIYPVKGIIKCNDYFSDEQANELISKKIQEMLCEKYNPGSTKGFIEKTLDKIFKKS